MVILIPNCKRHSCIIDTFIKLQGCNYQKKHSSRSVYCICPNGPKLQNTSEFIDYYLTVMNLRFFYPLKLLRILKVQDWDISWEKAFAEHYFVWLTFLLSWRKFGTFCWVTQKSFTVILSQGKKYTAAILLPMNPKFLHGSANQNVLLFWVPKFR